MRLCYKGRVRKACMQGMQEMLHGGALGSPWGMMLPPAPLSLQCVPWNINPLPKFSQGAKHTMHGVQLVTHRLPRQLVN